ncbi:hypothetical protein KGQ27_03065 [Patescibacteria group bacterium]|nr:hypothetical protein [Patescibacteria group bacterium]MDE1946749.1 hypothetical protein [Patescibacteria group bacterium]MDE2010948.1 hypothetical protein [Patescibacteria group bacterium]MDE2233563.1 hypothetical protein [Patescibacteria group bacterium]
MNRKPKTTYYGFTIVETLVAIAVLMIAVSGPLVVANKSLAAAIYAKDQTTAAYLAQEGMELIRSAKDNDIAAGNDWNNTIKGNSTCKQNGSTNNPTECAIGVDSSGYIQTGGCGIFTNNCVLKVGKIAYSYYDTLGNNGIFNTAPNSIFTRYFYITPISSNEEQATVIVDWNEGSVPNEVKFTTEITNSTL